MVEQLSKGIARFRRSYFRKNRETYLNLVRNGQSPSTLFITCADSRILPQTLTGSDPGDLFVVRNIGNMVPAYTPEQACTNVGSAIEYAVGVLGVNSIIVCGHSHCGACAALYDDEPREGLELTRRWLEQGKPVRDLILAKTRRPSEVKAMMASREQRAQIMRATEKAMVVQHLRNLETYPVVADRLAKGTLSLHGWYYRIESGEVVEYDREQLAFVPLPGHAPRRLKLAS